MTASKVDTTATRSTQSTNRWNNPQNVQRSAVPRVTVRCLFGPPDKEELKKIFDNNQKSEKQRMLNNYGFDIDKEKYVGFGSHGASGNKSAASGKKSPTGASRQCNNTKKTSDKEPYKQTCMTDFYSKQKKSKDTETKKNNSLEPSNNFQSFSRKNVNKV